MVCGMALGFKAVCIYRDYETVIWDCELVWFDYALMEPGNIFQPCCNKATTFCYELGF